MLGDGWCDSDGVPRLLCSGPLADPMSMLTWVGIDASLAESWTGKPCQCIDDKDTGRTRVACIREYRNTGVICANGSPSAYNVAPVAAGVPLYIHIPAPFCASGSCQPIDEVVRPECSVQRTGTTLQVQSHFVHESAPDGFCTGDCLIHYAHCQSEPLPAGSYTIVHGTRQLTITLPTAGPVPMCDPLLQ